MALQRLSQAQDQWRQRFGHLVGLCNMWPEDELHSSTRYSSEVYDPECPGGHHQCPEDAEGALDRGPKAQCQHGEDLHQAGGIFNGDRGAQGQVDPGGGSSPKPKSSPPAAPCRACDPAVRGGSERGPESAVNGDRRRNCPAEGDCCRTSSSVSHVSARLRGGSDPIPEGTHASKQSLKPHDGAIAMHDGGRLVETDTKMVSLPCDQQHGNSSFALMNAQDNNEPEDASLAEDFELLHFVESKKIGSSSKNHQKQNKKPLASASTNSMSPPQHMECLREEGNPTVGGSAKFCGLPLKIGRAAASLMAMLMLHAQVGLQGLLRGDERVDCWELFCAPDSWLTAACQSEGLRASRINLHQGYDLYQPSTYDELRERFHLERPKRVWVSTRCTYWCPWTSLNYRSIEQKQNLEKFRRKERAMFKLLIPFLVEMLTAYPDTELFWEWPTRCYGWKEPWLETLQRELHRLDRDWLFGRIDGCRYELRSQLGLCCRSDGLLPQAPTVSSRPTATKHAWATMTTTMCRDWRPAAVPTTLGRCASPLHNTGAENFILKSGFIDFTLHYLFTSTWLSKSTPCGWT